VIPIEFKIAGTTLSLFSTIAQFGTYLRIEMYFPADDETRHALTTLMPT